MAESKYEKYVIRKPAVIERVGDEYIDKIPETDEMPVWSDVDTGPRVIFSNDFIPNTTTKVEYGFLTGDKAVGNGEDFNPHKHELGESEAIWEAGPSVDFSSPSMDFFMIRIISSGTFIRL
jgi:hypothetical protein